jgi:hypothetical protein
MGEMASQDHSRFRAPVWFDCCNISPPRAGSIHPAVAASVVPHLIFQLGLASVSSVLRLECFALTAHTVDFFLGLHWDVSRCSRKFYAATADSRKRKFRLACDPRVECRRLGVPDNRVFALGIVFLAAASGAKQPDSCWYESIAN